MQLMRRKVFTLPWPPTTMVLSDIYSATSFERMRTAQSQAEGMVKELN